MLLPCCGERLWDEDFCLFLTVLKQGQGGNMLLPGCDERVWDEDFFFFVPYSVETGVGW